MGVVVGVATVLALIRQNIFFGYLKTGEGSLRWPKIMADQYQPSFQQDDDPLPHGVFATVLWRYCLVTAGVPCNPSQTVLWTLSAHRIQICISTFLTTWLTSPRLDHQ